MATHHEATSDDDDPGLRLGRAIERERSRRGWTAEEASHRAGVSSKTWQRLEDGKPVRNLTLFKVDVLFGLPRGTTFDAWSRGIDLQDLLGGGEASTGERPAAEPNDSDWSGRLAEIRAHLAGYQGVDADPEHALFDVIVVAINQLGRQKLDDVRAAVEAASQMRDIEEELGAPPGTVLYAPRSTVHAAPLLTVGNPTNGNLDFSKLVRRVADQIAETETELPDGER